MARISLTLAEWQAVARELAAAHNIAAGPGLLERVRSLLEQAPHSWPGQVYALEIDLAGIEAIRAVHASLEGRDGLAEQRAASVAEADAIIWNHQQQP